MSTDENEKGRWADMVKGVKFDGTINLSTLVHLAGLIVALFWFHAKVDRRTTVIEHQIIGISRDVERLDTKVEFALGNINALTVSQERLNTILAESLRRERTP